MRLLIEDIERRHQKKVTEARTLVDGEAHAGVSLEVDNRDGGHGVDGRLVPEDVADVGLVHHVVPLAAVQELGGCIRRELRVLGKEITSLVGEIVRGDSALGRVQVIPPRCDVQLVDVGRSASSGYRTNSKYAVRGPRRQLLVDALGAIG